MSSSVKPRDLSVFIAWVWTVVLGTITVVSTFLIEFLISSVSSGIWLP
jgi:hypothetical protein